MLRSVALAAHLTDVAGEDGSTPSSLHPDRYDHDHISSLEIFSQDLQKAIANSFPRPKTLYTSVHVLLLRWAEDDLNVQQELSTLKGVFENQYNFATEQWDIPSQNPTRALQAKLYDFQICHQSEDELLIVYYGGHGDADRRRGRSIWAANKKPDSPTITWSSLQHLLETAIPHVLIILDCCYAANAARDTSEGTTKELLAACGRENPTLGVGNRSFTSALIEELQAFGKTPFTVAMLHSRLVTMRWRLAFTPVYALLSEHGGHSIELSPRPPQEGPANPFESLESDTSDDAMDICSPETRTAADTHVLLAVSIADDATCDIVEWKKWLISQAPWDVTNIKVKVEAVFKSHSTMLVTSLPIAAWDNLPDKAAYKFINFVKSNNLSQCFQCAKHANERLADIATGHEQKLMSIKKQMRPFKTELRFGREGAGEGTVVTKTDAKYLRKQLEILRFNLRIQEEVAELIRETSELRTDCWEDERRGLVYEAQDVKERLEDVERVLSTQEESRTVPKDSSLPLVEVKGQGVSQHKDPTWYDSKIPPNPNVKLSNDNVEHLIPHIRDSKAAFMQNFQDDEDGVDEIEKLAATPRRPNASGRDENAFHGHKTPRTPVDANSKARYTASDNQDNSALGSDDEPVHLMTHKKAQRSTRLLARAAQASSVQGLETAENEHTRRAGDKDGPHREVQEPTSLPTAAYNVENGQICVFYG
ncbi:MAG: hypothetical protein Q9213_001240 [Squamulea squamosa]